MRKSFEYDFQPSQAYGNLDIENIGSCNIIANPDIEKFYFLTTRTEHGFTKICKFGPVLIGHGDLQYIVDSFKFELISFEYSEARIVKQIDQFLNSNGITQAREIDEEELINNCNIELLKFISKQGEQNYE